MRRLPACVLPLALLVSTPALGDPFGIRMGQGIDGLEVEDSSSFRPRLESVPNPHPAFSEYAVWHAPGTGVCRIVALSMPFENDRYGSNVRKDFERVRGALEAKYGEGRAIDRIKDDALWTGDNEWVMALTQNERIFAHIWEDIGTPEGERLASIQLWVEGLSNDTAGMLLEYRSTDFEACVEEIEASEDAAF